MKRILAMVLSVAIIATIAIGGTVAFLTDKDGAANTMTTGMVEIKQYEQDRYGNDFQQNQIILPITGSAQTDKETGTNRKGYPKEGMNYVDKLVTVENTGNTPAYVRTLIAVPKYTYDGQSNSQGDNVLHYNTYWEGTAYEYKNENSAKHVKGMQVDDKYYRLDSQRIPGSYGKADVLVANKWSNDDNNIVSNVSINGKTYEVYITTHQTALATGERTAPNLSGFYLDSHVDYNHDTKKYTYNGKEITGLTGQVDILVLSQAVQAGGFADANTAFDAALPLGDDAATTIAGWFSGIVESGATVGGSDDLENLRTKTSSGNSVLLDSNIDANVVNITNSTNRVNYTLFEQNGGVFNGNGNTLSANWKNGVIKDNEGNAYSTACIVTHGGTIKNVTLDKADRAIFLQKLTEDVIIENVKAASDDVGYALNTGNAGTGLHKLSVKDSTFGGWFSFGNLESASFENCKFVSSEYFSNPIFQKGMRPYVNTTFKNCTFENDYYLSLSELSNSCNLTFINCKVGGTLITEDNFISIFGTLDCTKDGKYQDFVDTYADISSHITISNT